MGKIMAEKKSFWTNIPGILKGIGAVIVALTGLYIALNTTQKSDTGQVLTPTTTTEALSLTEWPIIAEETFTTEPLNWIISNYPTERFPRSDLRLVDGKYRWDIEYSKKDYHSIFCPIGSVINFNVAVDMKLIEHTSDMSFGIIFSSTGNDYYLFDISASRYFGLTRKHDGIEQMIIDWTPITVAFEPKEWNRMSVVVDDQLIRLYLNSELLSERRDTGFTGGKVGIGLKMYERGETVVDFDNFQFRRKP